MAVNNETEWSEADLIELCARPEYSASDYCLNREPGETPAQFNQRRLREQNAPLEVTVTEGVRLPGAGWLPIAAAIAIGVALAYASKRG